MVNGMIRQYGSHCYVVCTVAESIAAVDKITISSKLVLIHTSMHKHFGYLLHSYIIHL